MKSLFGFLLVITGSLFLSSCFFGFGDSFSSRPFVDSKIDSSSSEEEDSSLESPLRRRVSKESDPKKQIRCQEMGQSPCQGDEDCEEICDDIFSRSSDKKQCRDLPSELVYEFERLFELVDEAENVSDMKPEVLECLLDIDEKPFVREMGGLTRTETMDFLVEVAVNKELADVVEGEDDENLLLKRLFNNLDSAVERLKKLAFNIAGRTNMFELIFEKENERAWNWLNDYVEEQCENSSLCYSEKKEDYSPVVFYCRLFLGMNNRGRLGAVLNSRVFRDYFGHEIEREKICGSDGDQNCELGHRDHFESFCLSYTDETSL